MSREDAIVKWHTENDMVLILASLGLFIVGLGMIFVSQSLSVSPVTQTGELLTLIAGGVLASLGMATLATDMVLQQKGKQETETQGE